jgi:hypothetical protein
LSFYEGEGVRVGVGVEVTVGVRDLKTEELELEVLCTNSTALLISAQMIPCN